ncbi:MAG: WXG100 family type VII secretion target [Bacilli bacterium]|nr:WXG100 family type VII secretion target [Bacilli bacterium]
MNGNIRLDSTQSLREKATKVLSLADEFNNALSRAGSAVDGIMENWKDDNAKIYEGNFNELRAKFSTLYENLQAMGNALNKEADALDEQTARERTAVEGRPMDNSFDNL